MMNDIQYDNKCTYFGNSCQYRTSSGCCSSLNSCLYTHSYTPTITGSSDQYRSMHIPSGDVIRVNDIDDRIKNSEKQANEYTEKYVSNMLKSKQEKLNRFQKLIWKLLGLL